MIGQSGTGLLRRLRELKVGDTLYTFEVKVCLLECMDVTKNVTKHVILRSFKIYNDTD